MWTVPPVVLKEEDREELERWVRAHKSSQRQVRRAQIVLMAHYEKWSAKGARS